MILTGHNRFGFYHSLHTHIYSIQIYPNLLFENFDGIAGYPRKVEASVVGAWDRDGFIDGEFPLLMVSFRDFRRPGGTYRACAWS